MAAEERELRKVDRPETAPFYVCAECGFTSQTEEYTRQSKARPELRRVFRFRPAHAGDGTYRLFQICSADCADVFVIPPAQPESMIVELEINVDPDCLVCGGSGVIEWTETRTETAHAGGCDGYKCASDCPIPIPVEEQQQEPCPSCNGRTSNMTLDDI